MAMPQKTISKHNSSPASRSVSEASVSSPSSHELLSDVSIVACFQVPDKMPSSSLVSLPLAGGWRPGASGPLGLFWCYLRRDTFSLIWTCSVPRPRNKMAGSVRPGRAPKESLMAVPAQPRACPSFCSKKKISFFNIFFLAYLDPIGHARDIEKNDAKKWGTIS
jgi:hypothetical protein